MTTKLSLAFLPLGASLLTFACAVPAPDDEEVYGESDDSFSESGERAPSDALMEQSKSARATAMIPQSGQPTSILGCLFQCQDDYSECIDQAGGHPDLEKHCGIEKKHCINECSNPSPTTPLDPPKGIIH